jgi:hypothetical protein
VSCRAGPAAACGWQLRVLILIDRLPPLFILASQKRSTSLARLPVRHGPFFVFIYCHLVSPLQGGPAQAMPVRHGLIYYFLIGIHWKSPEISGNHRIPLPVAPCGLLQRPLAKTGLSRYCVITLFFKPKGWTWLVKAVRPSKAPLNRNSFHKAFGPSQTPAAWWGGPAGPPGRQGATDPAAECFLQPAHPPPPPSPRTPDPIPKPQYVKEQPRRPMPPGSGPAPRRLPAHGMDRVTDQIYIPAGKSQELFSLFPPLA